jgi:hypothetical protein
MTSTTITGTASRPLGAHDVQPGRTMIMSP